MKKMLSIMTVVSIILMVFVLTGCENKPTTPPNVTLEGSIINSENQSTMANVSQTTNSETTTTDDKFQNVSYTITAK